MTHCDTNTHKVNVLGDFDVNYKGRHNRSDDCDRDFDALRDLLAANREGEAHRDIIETILKTGSIGVRETLESKYAVTRDVIEAKADILQAVAGVGTRVVEEVKEAKHDLAVRVLENEANRLRDLLLWRDRGDRGGCRSGGGCGDH